MATLASIFLLKETLPSKIANAYTPLSQRHDTEHDMSQANPKDVAGNAGMLRQYDLTVLVGQSSEQELHHRILIEQCLADATQLHVMHVLSEVARDTAVLQACSDSVVFQAMICLV